MALEQKIEAVLFYKGEPETRDRLARLLHVTEKEVDEACEKLSGSLQNRGIRLLRMENQFELVTAPETSEVITEVKKEELSRDLGKAGSETLAIVLYRGPVARATIDYIRGVNSSFILRNLQIRGLVKKVHHPNDSRSFLYQATPELLKHLGVTDVTELPRYSEMMAELDALEKQQDAEENNPEGEEKVPETMTA